MARSGYLDPIAVPELRNRPCPRWHSLSHLCAKLRPLGRSTSYNPQRTYTPDGSVTALHSASPPPLLDERPLSLPAHRAAVLHPCQATAFRPWCRSQSPPYFSPHTPLRPDSKAPQSTQLLPHPRQPTAYGPRPDIAISARLPHLNGQPFPLTP